jgi:O-methyltransferase
MEQALNALLRTAGYELRSIQTLKPGKLFRDSAWKSALKGLIRKSGYEVRRPPYATDMQHEPVSPVANYSPWLTDASFKNAYYAIKSNTLVDHYRCYEIWQLVGEAAKLASGDLIEIGVWRGGSGALIAKRCQAEGLESTVFLCDTFTGVVKAGARDTQYNGGEHSDTSRQVAEELAAGLGLKNVQILEGMFPEDTGHLIRDRTFRFCHIDVDVYESAKDIIEWIWGRLVPGALVVYDDYGIQGCEGITRFVNSERAKPDRLVIHNLNGHAIVVKI